MPSSISDRIIDYISYVQREKSITKERFYSIRQYFFQSVGFCVLLYFLSQLLKLLFRLIFQIFSIIFWLPLKAMESFLLKSDNYNIMFLLFCLCSVFSFTIAKFSHKKFRQRYSFILTFVIILLLQSLFILLPIATSIQARSKLSSIPIDVKQKIVKLSEIDKMPGQENNFIKNFENNKRAEFIPVNNGVKLNESTKNLTGKMIINSQNKLSSSLGKESDIEDEQNMNTAEKSPTNLQISSNEEQKLLLKQQGNTLVDYTEQFNSKISENSSQFIPEKTEQIEETEKRKISLTFRQKFTNWLDNTRNIFYQTKLDFQKFFSFSKKPLSQYTITTIYTAFTDLNCYDYTKLTHRYKQNYKYFLNAYRHRSPFSIYLSIIKSNGPKCYPYYPNSSCAIRSKLVFSNLKKQLFRFTRFWMIISLLITILIFIYKRLQYKQKYNPLNQSSNKTNELPLQQISSNIPNNPLDKKIENQLRLWLEQEQNDGYQNISESCRKALNTTFSKEYVSKCSRLFEKI